MKIKIEGAIENNLKDIDIEFGDGLTVVTGVSGSGKSSLVFDTLYHEARRRFLEYFSSGSKGLRLTPAKVRSITGLGPALAVGQNLLNRNPNSILATATGLHPLFRILFARFGTRLCPNCKSEISILSDDEIVDYISKISKSQNIEIYAQILNNVVGSHLTLLEFLIEQFNEENIIVDSIIWDKARLDPFRPHEILVRVDIIDSKSLSKQIKNAVENCKALGASVLSLKKGNEWGKISLDKSCHQCGLWLQDLEPKHFHMPCPHCRSKGCNKCDGTGLHPLASSVFLNQIRISDLIKYSIEDAYQFFNNIILPSTAERILSEILKRIDALNRVGLNYLTLDRSSPSLSRGEAQRVRIAISLVSQLEDMIHVLDEPTIGQHVSDVRKFLPIFRKLNGPVIYVEHDKLAASVADHIIDIGPGAGLKGGEITFKGTPRELWDSNTITGKYFSSQEKVKTPKSRTSPDKFISIKGANLHNLKNIHVKIPLQRLTVITGVSGSGKSTLVEDILYSSLKKKKPVGCKEISELYLKAVMVDQSPIGKNPRSNPATYTKISDIIRKLFSKITNLSESHFSFNRPEGACPTCKGMGAIEVKMRYLPSTWIPCNDCNEERFNEEVLSKKIRLEKKEYSIADFYNLKISEIIPLIKIEKHISENELQKLLNMLRTLEDIGLGYLSLGQPSPSLSGGEAQRIKLAKYLGKNSLKDQLIILDEPSTGLHPYDITGLLKILDKIVRYGATVIIVEHNLDIIRAADWIIDLGPGAGLRGGNLIYSGLLKNFTNIEKSETLKELKLDEKVIPHSESVKERESSKFLTIKNAHVHNLQNIDVKFPKNKLTVVTGVSGSGKSSLVIDIIELEAKRRYLETLSMYERQGTKEGAEALVDDISGLGVTSVITPENKLYSRFLNLRNTVGKVTEIHNHISNLLTFIGEKLCPTCNKPMKRENSYICKKCNSIISIPPPRFFNPSNYRAACTKCHGVGTLPKPRPDKLIIHPEKPICNGAMYSPGFFPKGYLCKPYNFGYYMLQAIAKKFEFNPFKTPWNEMTKEAQDVFLFGSNEKVEVYYENRKGQNSTRIEKIKGIYTDYIRDWDIGGTYSDIISCDMCKGAKLKPEYLSITLNGFNTHQLSELPLVNLIDVIKKINLDNDISINVSNSLKVIKKRLEFLIKTGLGYINLNRATDSLSAGEAQRIMLAGLLGTGLTSLTVLLDEPSRGMHPTELQSLLEIIYELRDNGNTVIMVEHDPIFWIGADYLVDMGPGAGINGGLVVAEGTPEKIKQKNTVTANWMNGSRAFSISKIRKKPSKWVIIEGARANNLKGEKVRIPKGLLVGFCGVSGSGKSSLIIDTLGRALAPMKHTTSVAYEPIIPGEYEKIEGNPSQTIIIDQSKAKISTPLKLLNLDKPLLKLFTESEDAISLNIKEKDLKKKCTVCKGTGQVRTDMGFLPDIINDCEICDGTGYSSVAWQVKLKGYSLPEINNLTINQVYELFKDEDIIKNKLETMMRVGLGYLVMNQSAYTLSGGEAQRLKIAKEITKKTLKKTFYILDEPTIGLHLEDTSRLIEVLKELVNQGHTVVVIEHHPHVLASCDWLIELGPKGGPDGGKVIAEGTPEDISRLNTPSAPYIKDVLEALL